MRQLPISLHSYEHGSVAAPRFTFLAPGKGLLPVVRWPMGYQLLHPSQLIVRSILLALIPPVFWLLWYMLTRESPPPNEGRQYLEGYVAAVFMITLLRFMKRSLGQGRGEEIHTEEAGHSLVTWLLPLPVAWCEQIIVPGLLGWAGWEIMHGFSFDLGVWLMICAPSYFLLANWEWRNRAAQHRAPVDDKIRAQHFSDTIDRHEHQASKPKRKDKRNAYASNTQEYDIAEVGKGRRW